MSRLWVIWIAVVVIWTALLEFPGPFPDDPQTEGLQITLKLVASKLLHIGVYSGLTVLSAWVPMPIRFRWIMMFFLMFHAWLTEMLQLALNKWCHRTGLLVDVGFDILGIGIGIALSWKYWTRET